jgi:hypothetical protein
LAGWKPEDIERYNRAAIEVMRASGVAVIDLHALVARQPEWWLENIHFTEQGYREMAECVKNAIGWPRVSLQRTNSHEILLDR